MISLCVWVEGCSALLLHRATEEALMGDTRSNAVGEREDPRTIAGKAVYRLPGSEQLALPGAAFARLVREAGSAHKTKGSRKSLKYLVPSAVIIADDLAPLYLCDRKTPIVDFEVDSRPVTIPSTKGRVMRHRARVNEWCARAHVEVDETILQVGMVRQLLAEGGRQIGVGDFRPEKGGPFGRFDIVAWDVVSDAKAPSTAQKRNGGAQPHAQ